MPIGTSGANALFEPLRDAGASAGPPGELELPARQGALALTSERAVRANPCTSLLVITETLRCHYLTTVAAEPKPSSTVAVPKVKLAFYFANALIRPSVFGLPQPVVKS